MNRSISKEALVLSVRLQGENNRTVCLATKDGIEYSLLYGGPKSRLKSQVSPWNSGTMYFYNDEAKKSSKITDFDVKKYHLSFRESLFKSWAASLAAEIVLKTKCAGSPEQAFILLNGFIDGLELCDENEGVKGLLRFLWRYLGLLGVQSETDFCGDCGKSLFDIKSNQVESRQIYFSKKDKCFLCEDCAASENDSVLISEKALEYLRISSGNDYKKARLCSIGEGTVNELRQFLYELTEDACGTKLNALHSGLGIL